MDPKDRISAADLFNELQKLPRNASLTAVAQVVEREGAAEAERQRKIREEEERKAAAKALDPKVLFPATALHTRPNFIPFAEIAGCCRLSHPRQTQHP